MNLFELTKSIQRGIRKLAGTLDLLGSRLRAELALLSEMKKYEAIKEELNQTLQEIGQRVLEETPDGNPVEGPYRDLIEKARALQKALKEKEEDMHLIVNPETE